MPPTASDIAGWRSFLDGFLTTTATNSRTSLTSPCWVMDQKRDIRVDELPSFIHLRRVRLTVPAGTDVEPGDFLTVPAKGVYAVIETSRETTIQDGIDCYGILSRAYGSTTLPIPNNADVVFRQKGRPGRASEDRPSIQALVYPVSRDDVVNRDVMNFTHCVIGPDPLTFTDGQRVSTNDFILTSAIRAAEATLDYPAHYAFPLVMFKAYFNDHS